MMENDDEGAGGGGSETPPADASKEGETLITGDAAPKEGDAADASKEGDKKEEVAKPEPLTLEAIKLPEGVEFDPELGPSFIEIMNDEKLTPAERAQKLVDLQTTVLTKASERASEAWEQTLDQWRSDFRNDPEIGGSKFAASLETANAIVDRFSKNSDGSSTGLKEMLKMTGLGNHPEFGRFLVRLSPFLREPTDVPGGGAMGGKPVPTKNNLYPEQG